MPDAIPRAAARYDYGLHIGPTGDEVIVVIDLGEGKSVTNDAAAVVAEIADELGGLGARPMIYRDTTGRYDGLDHDGRRFVGFYPIGLTCMTAAVRWVDQPSPV